MNKLINFFVSSLVSLIEEVKEDLNKSLIHYNFNESIKTMYEWYLNETK
jgi:hypothetical protein